MKLKRRHGHARKTNSREGEKSQAKRKVVHYSLRLATVWVCKAAIVQEKEV